ncbi:hypothetical protein [Ectobacillus polymachus]|uniref:hypothetical protein n=1 Tax=Ectobacillus polymachus TaxID=1508806 RepID=UPI003A8C49C0
MQISGVGHNAMQYYQTIRATQQSQAQVQQVDNKVNQSTQQLTNLSDPDHDGDIDGKGRDIDVRI